MAPRNPVRAPTNSPVHDSLRVPATAKSLVKSLIRLSKPALIDLALQWLLEENQATCAPYLASNRNLEEEVDEDYLWSPAESIEELRLTYNRMRFESDIKKRYIIDRILDGDWRRGMSLYQVATIDFQCLSENDKALRWTALKLVPQSDYDSSGQEPLKKKRKTNQAPYPTVSPSTFIRNLQREISPTVKAHYYLHRLHAPQNLSVVRICVADSPYTNPQSSVQSSLLFTDPTRLIFIALPDSCPYIYVSVAGAAKEAASRTKKSLAARMDITSLKRTVLEEIPKALSKSQHRYALESTSLTARSLSTMLALRGNNSTNAASGAYTIFSKGLVDNSPIDAERTTFAQKVLQACEGEEDAEPDSKVSELSLRPHEQAEKRTALAEKSTNPQMAKNLKSEEERLDLKIAAATRFGVSDIAEKKPESAHSEVGTTTCGLDRLQVRLDEDLVSHHGLPLSLTAHNIKHHDVDPFDQTSPSDPTSGDLPKQGSARMTLTFQGSDIFLGIRKLVESGAIGIQKLPAWMTGEEAISGGIVRGGIVVRGKGGGA
jgi:central kinetochore subunit Mis15/CHL4